MERTCFSSSLPYFLFALTALLFLCNCPAAEPAPAVVADSLEALSAAVQAAAPGDTIALAPGAYEGGISLEAVHGEEGAPITIAAADPDDPPVFSGGHQALHLIDCSYVTVRNLHVRGYSANGINADDGGDYETPAHHLVFEGIVIENIGPQGNFDALKLSGLDDFTVRDCTFRGWGGSAIDMVGCHRGLIEGCTFIGKEGHSQTTGIQMKGGSAEVEVLECYFEDAAGRAINLGGSTGLDFFRPMDAPYEARDITVAGNIFVGGGAAVAFVTQENGHVHHNTIINPERWVLRILQETDNPRFVSSRNGVFEHNLIVYDESLRSAVNVGPGTQPETFQFRNNAWFNTSGPTAPPELPTPEEDGVYGVDPQLSQPLGPETRAQSQDPRLDDIGAGAWREEGAD